ncbi:MAG: CorA family divalent cation transporter, partial [Pseudomonadales bacterium]|nr:CorA family divalent cation transporter [Pseudomonadales bacterium]
MSEAREIFQESCYVFGLTLDGEGRGIDIHESGIVDKPLWFHFDYSEPGSEECLEAMGIAPEVVQSIVRQDTRPRTLVMKEGVLVILRAINVNPGDEPDDMVSVRLWIEPKRLITVRQRRVFSAQNIRESLARGEGPRNIQELVVGLVEVIADGIGGYIDSMEERMDLIEDAQETNGLAGLRSRVSALRRQAATVRRYLAPQRDALDNLYRQSKGI